MIRPFFICHSVEVHPLVLGLGGQTCISPAAGSNSDTSTIPGLNTAIGRLWSEIFMNEADQRRLVDSVSHIKYRFFQSPVAFPI